MRRLALGLLLVAFLTRLAVGQATSGDVVINEIMYAPTPSTNEFVELYNRADTAVDLSQLALADANRDFTVVTSADTTLAPGAYAVLVRDAEAFREAYPDVSVFVLDDWESLNNGGDTVYLRHSSTGTSLDSVAYDPGWGGSDGRSLERIDPAGPSNSARNFASSEADAGATPGAQNSVYDPDETPPALKAATPSPDGDSITAVFSEPLEPSTVSATAFRLEPAAAPSVVSAQHSSSAPRRVRCALSDSLSTGDYTLVASGVADRRGNVLEEGRASFSFFVAEPPAAGDVVINEIRYAPATASNEFVELYNRSDKTIDLGALQYADADRDFDPVAPPLTALKPDEYAVLVRDSAAFSTQFPSISFRTPAGWDALNNGGDTVVLRHGPSTTTLDEVPYRPSWGGRDGRSLERIDPRGPSDVPSNFASSTAPEGATPGAQNSQYAPDTTPPSPVFAEQVGETRAEVVFDEPVQAGSVRPAAFRLGTVSVTTAARTAPRTVRLTLSEPPTATTLQVRDIRDLVGNRREQAALPFAYRPFPEGLVVTEVLYAPRADDFDDQPNQVEYVELYNLADRPLTLNGLFLTDRPTETGRADTTRAGRRRAVLPGSYGVVAAAPEGATAVQRSQLAAAFPEAPLVPDSVAYLPVDAAQLGLRNDGDLIRVHRADGAIMEEVAYSPDWHASGLADRKGTALERISPTADANAPDNWTSSTAAAGGTPGAPNAVSLSPPDDAPSAPGLRVAPSPFSIERDGATRIRFTLTEVPNLVRVRIYDARGRKVRTLEEARLAGRTGELVWNGRDDAGDRVRVGIYVVLLEAVRADGGTTTQLKETVVLARPLD
ncbi:MAG: lamin tail domain-containing protein [Salinibacter sp.]|uniref:lamin tail domain-containing protein n=1 Tax=Salinibacter sp. TaxID=2065818 RepID=UPI0035D41161